VWVSTCPYTDRALPTKAWRQIDALHPEQFTLTSFASEDTLARLCDRYPDAAIVVRPRTGPQHQPWPTSILDYRSWPSERSLRDCLGYLVGRSMDVRLVMGNEPRNEWAPPWPGPEQNEVAARQYSRWYLSERPAIKATFPGVPVAPAPHDQGDDNGTAIWLDVMEEAGCYAEGNADFLADHCYYTDQPFDAESWGGRWRVLRQRFPHLGAVWNLETNDNGNYGDGDTQDRANLLKLYILRCRGANPADLACVSLFTIKGAPDDDGKPQWWFLGDRMIAAAAEAMAVEVATEPPLPVAVQPAPEPAPPEPIQEPAMPTSDPWEHFSAEQIATASGCPLDAVTEHWPRIVRQLALCGIADRPVQVAAIGTVAIETASTFRPIHEYGTEADWADYEGGPEYAGRGFIQLTHRSNYRTFGEYVDDLWHAGGAIDLVARPDDALDPDVAAAVLATYFVHHTTLQGYSIPDAARAGDWEWVRRLVQGGDAGLSRLVRIASALEGAPMPTKVAFDANEPAHAQEESFDCSQEALEWALFAVGRRPSDDWLENTMIDEGVMSKEQGLLDATGKGLADFVTRQYGEFGFYANNEPSVTFDAVAAEIGPYPLLIGGRRWSHWSGVRGYDAIRDILLLANPADGWQGVKQTMNRAQFDALGPFSMVRVLHPDLVPAAEPAPPAPEPAPAPPPAPEPAPPAMTLADVRARLLAIQDEITALLANLPAA
jgi:hypothetical protein